MVWGKALYSSMKVISNSGWTILTIWLMLHGSFKFGAKYHTTSKLGCESTERPLTDVLPPAKIFSRKLLASQLLPVTSVVQDLPRQVGTNFRNIPHSSHVRRWCQVSLPLVAKRFWKTGRSGSKTWQQHQRNAASVSSQRCLRITPAVGMLHIVTLWTHPDTWVMLGFKSFFGPKSLQSLRP